MPEYNKPEDQPAFIVDHNGMPTKIKVKDKWYDMIPSVSYPEGVVNTVKWLRDYAQSLLDKDDMFQKKNDNPNSSNIVNNLFFAADALEDYALKASNPPLAGYPFSSPYPYPYPYPNTNPAPYPMLCKHEFIAVPASDNPGGNLNVISPAVIQCRLCGYRPASLPVSKQS